ncbi:MAG: arginine--tRNA ligase [Candidatus Magasanikbacteria bacterium]|nr:arginine--tRNA ligase [Candidatus Magasanikbacteria bacterium]
MLNKIKKQLESILTQAGVEENIVFTKPPKLEMGDFAFACFELAKKEGKNPAEVAKEMAEKMKENDIEIVEDVKAFGPYVNFFLDAKEVAKITFEAVDENYGKHDIGKGKKVLVEFACPNPFKAFHLGHLKNLISGESVVRIFENAGYDVKRVNYQGDVGMHVAKALWGIFDLIKEFETMKEKELKERVEFLGRAYAHGASYFEKDEESKQEVIAYNDKVYEHDKGIEDVYNTARQWSLDYFAEIYARMGSSFDRLYFESEVFEKGVELVKKGQEKGIFRESEGAVIFPGSEYDLHDRVYINSKGFPTYDAKELALAEMHFKEHSPDKIIHVVGKEQTEYFKVAFKALEQIHKETIGKEHHLIGGFLQLKGDQKMSSRSGNIVTGDQLIDAVKVNISQIMEESDLPEDVNKNEIIEKVTNAALKYTMLRADVSKDVAFDIEESVSVSGNSGPYLLYTVARINSILEKVGNVDTLNIYPENIDETEKALLLSLGEYHKITAVAVEAMNPSVVAQYIFDVAQKFQSFYASCPVLQEEGDTKLFRLRLITAVRTVMVSGLGLLGIETVEAM